MWALLLLLLSLIVLAVARRRRGSRLLGLVLHEQRRALTILGPPRPASRLELVAVLHGVLPPSACAAAVDALVHGDVPWRTDRHCEHPTVDVELCDALPWLDDALAAAMPGLCGALAHTFCVDASCLWLREAFVVRYDAAGGQAGLEAHRDASVFSFVLPIAQAERGGGTTFGAQRGPALVPGDALLFCGRRLHGAEPVQRGRRLVIAGFVDLRVGLPGLRRLSRQLHALDPAADCSSCRALPRPYLLSTVRALERRSGRCGRALVASLAARRVRVPFVDLEPLAAGCAAHLAGKGACVDAATRRFIATACARERDVRA